MAAKGAEQGVPPAQFALGGLANAHGNTAEALKWYRLAAAAGDDGAQNNLGHMYESGNGVKQSYSDAAQWFRRAADQGLAAAQYNLGVLYDNGHGVAATIRRRRNGFASPRRRATPTRNTISAFCTMTATACRMTTPRRPNGFGFPPTRATCRRRTISAFVCQGDGVPKDDVQAYMWFALSAAQGNSVAVGNLQGAGGPEMTPAQIAAAKDLARQWKPKPAQ